MWLLLLLLLTAGPRRPSFWEMSMRNRSCEEMAAKAVVPEVRPAPPRPGEPRATRSAPARPGMAGSRRGPAR